MLHETPPSSPKRDRKCPDAPKKNKNFKINVTNLDLIPQCIFPNISNINMNGSNFISTPINWDNYQNE